MAKMIGKQLDVKICHPQCAYVATTASSNNRKAKRKYLRHLKHRERQALKKEITDQQA